MSENNIALLIIDMQNDFVLPESPFAIGGAFKTVPILKSILSKFRAKNLPVFHIIREYREDGSDIELFRHKDFIEGSKYAVPGTFGCEIVSDLTPIEGEYKVVKPRFSGFMNTELDYILRRIGVTKLVITGTQYPNCIRATAFDAVAHGYEVTVVTDATSAKTEEIANANIVDLRNIGIQCITGDELKL